MAINRRPTKSRVIAKKSTLTNNNKVNKKSTESTQTNELNHLQIKLEQLAIDKHNNLDVYTIDPFFKDLHLNSDCMIVRIMKEDYIKYSDNSNPDAPIVDAFYSQVNVTQRTSDELKTINTPFPYIEKAVIVAISPDIQLSYYKKIEEIKKYDVELAESIVVPKVGDVVEIKTGYNRQWYQNNRYYIDPQERTIDYMINPLEHKLIYFDHHYQVEGFDFRAIDKSSSKRGFYANSEWPEWATKLDKFYSDEIKDLDNKLVTILEEEKARKTKGGHKKTADQVNRQSSGIIEGSIDSNSNVKNKI
jgi:hypothetical protein